MPETQTPKLLYENGLMSRSYQDFWQKNGERKCLIHVSRRGQGLLNLWIWGSFGINANNKDDTWYALNTRLYIDHWTVVKYLYCIV